MPAESTTAPSLLELQRWLAWIITEPRGVAAALADRRGEPAPSCLAAIAEPPGHSRVEGLDAYAEGYFVRLLSSLSDHFPSVERQLGEQRFGMLVAGYLSAFPSRYANIVEVGMHLADYMAGHPYSQALPFLPDLAALEWRVIAAKQAEVEAGWSADALASLTDEQFAQATLELEASVSLLTSDWPLHRIFSGAELAPPLASEKTCLLIHRRDGRVAVEALTPEAHAVLDMIARKVPLAHVSAQAAEAMSAEALQAHFAQWASWGLFRALILKASQD